MASVQITVLEGDQMGQELLDPALRVLASDVLGFEVELDRHDLSLARRRATGNDVVHAAAAAMLRSGLGIKGRDGHPGGARRRGLSQPHPP